MWRSEFVDEIAQVYPIDDIIPHELMDDANCPCLPQIKSFDTPHGWDYLIAHNAWDNRE